MTVAIDYFLSPQSPWTYLGHERFAEIARRAGATINVLPVDLGRVFPVSGGLPLAKRAPQRQAYRLVELKRFSEHLGRPLNLHPRYFPVASDDAAKLIIAVDSHDGSAAAMTIAGGDPARRLGRGEEHRRPERAAGDARRQPACRRGASTTRSRRRVHERYEQDSQRAIDSGVFGAPTYVAHGEMFWGQDRLDFLERRLARG